MLPFYSSLSDLEFKEEVKKEFDEIRDKLQPLTMKYNKEKERVDELRRLKQKRDELQYALQEAERRYDLARRYGAIQDVEAAIAKLETETNTGSILAETVGPEQIVEVVSRWTGIPVTRLGQNEKERLIGLAERLHQRVVGQDHAVSAVAEAVLRSRARLGRAKQPTGSVLFLGPTGVRKTKLAKALAEQLFDDDKLLIRIDMSKYMEQHSVACLIGAPPGYVGHEEGGQPTEAVRRRPYCVVLFDEVEKAHPAVFNVLLQVLDDGRLTDGQGRTVDFTNSVVILTSNLGSEYLLSGLSGKVTMESAREMVMQEVRKHFKPELQNRLDEIAVFGPLKSENKHKEGSAKKYLPPSAKRRCKTSSRALAYFRFNHNPKLRSCVWCKANKKIVREESGYRVIKDAGERRNRRKLDGVYQCSSKWDGVNIQG